MDNKTLRATLLIGGHGYGVIQLFAAIQETAGIYASMGYTGMALGPAFGLLFAWFALTILGNVKDENARLLGFTAEGWLTTSAWFMFVTINGIILSVALFWSVTPH